MRYYAQKEDCCMPTALYQVGAISIDVLHAFEKDYAVTALPANFFQQDWSRQYFLPLVSFFDTNYSIGSSNVISMPLMGKGILILHMDTDILSRHAISYENGLVLDSAENEELMTWEKYAQTYPKRTLLKVIPTG